MRVVLVATHPIQPTGYARVAHELSRRLRWRVHLFVYGVQPPAQGVHGVPRDVQYAVHAAGPADGGFDVGGLAPFVQRVRADAVVLYNDPFVCGAYMRALEPVKVKAVVYLDLVHDGIRTSHWDSLARADAVWVMSECWRRIVQPRVPCSTRVAVVPHAVSSTIRPLDRTQAREALALPDTALVVLNMNKFVERKRYDVYALAIARFLARRPDADVLFLGNAPPDVLLGVVAAEMARLGAPPRLDRVRGLASALSDELVNAAYNAADVGVNVADGEGFGLCSFEHAALGRCQIVSRVGGLADMFDESCAVVLPPVVEGYHFRDAMGGRTLLVDPDALAAAFEAVLDEGVRQKLGAAAKARFAAWPSWDDVADLVATELRRVAQAAAHT